jgi:molybdopterin synthase catalytic subunit
MVVKVQQHDFDAGEELSRLSNGKDEVGAVASFIGLVRKTSDGTPLGAMTLEHYPGMTERQLEQLELQARERWPLDDVLIIHRFGRLEPGEQIVLCAAASSHRQDAFEACMFLMDWLKTKAPFWKFEETENGGNWVTAKHSDDQAADRWN